MSWQDCCCPVGMRCIRCTEETRLGTFETRTVCAQHGPDAPAYLVRRHRDGKGRVLCGWSVYEFVHGRWNVYRRISQHETFELALAHAKRNVRVAYWKPRPIPFA